MAELIVYKQKSLILGSRCGSRRKGEFKASSATFGRKKKEILHGSVETWQKSRIHEKVAVKELRALPSKMIKT